MRTHLFLSHAPADPASSEYSGCHALRSRLPCHHEVKAAHAAAARVQLAVPFTVEHLVPPATVEAAYPQVQLQAVLRPGTPDHSGDPGVAGLRRLLCSLLFRAGSHIALNQAVQPQHPWRSGVLLREVYCFES